MTYFPGKPRDLPMRFNIFGGGGGGSSKTTQDSLDNRQSLTSSRSLGDTASGGYSQTILPDYIENLSRETADLARSVASRPYEPYEGARVAGFNPDHTTGFEAVRGHQGAWRPYIQGATGPVTGIANRTPIKWTEADVAGYMNPYLQQVMDRALLETNRQAGIDRANIEGALASQGAFGGSAHGVELAEHGRNVQDLRQNLIANLLSSGYESAAQRFQYDEGNRLASDQLRLGAGQTLADLGGAASRLGYSDAAAMLDIADKQQALEQRKLDVAYEDFLRQFYYPVEMLGLQTSTLGALPYGTTTINETIGRNVGNTAQNVSSLNQGRQTAKTSGGGGGGNLASTLGSFASIAGAAASMFSSKDYKEDVDEPDTILEAVKRLPVKAWRYKPEMGLGTERHVGPFAEDFHELFGLGDGKSIPVVDAIGVNLAATKELATAIERLEAE